MEGAPPIFLKGIQKYIVFISSRRLERLSAYIPVLGRPYRWAQILSGLSYLPKDQEQVCIF